MNFLCPKLSLDENKEASIQLSAVKVRHMFLGHPTFHTNLKGYQVQNTTANVRDVAHLELVYVTGEKENARTILKNYLGVS